MATALVKIDVHLVFHVKSTLKTIRKEDKTRLYEYIGGIIKSMGGIPMGIGGTEDHVHILFSLPKSSSIAECAKVIKSKSSLWIKTIDTYYSMFSWQEGYGAFSVSPTLLDKTRAYIQNQESHHIKRTFREECMMFAKAYNVEFDEKYMFVE